jgi:glucuronokinase
MIITKKAYARAGLIGNPSDGYYGRTISIVVKNFCAQVTLYETPDIEIIPNARDHSKFTSIGDLAKDVRLHGYYGGVRLIKATAKKFHDYCVQTGVVPADKNFTIRYQSDIPRQVGLAGSSAIITATLRALMEFYGVSIPKPIQPNLILSVEKEELGISAGLQDRVIQVFEGMVYMDFSKDIMEKQGYGNYEPMDPNLLPPLFIAYRTDLSEVSNIFHDNIRQRWQQGDKDVVAAMKDFASYAEKARECLLAGRREELGPLMDMNFNRRASIYRISERNLDLVHRGRKVGANVKFSGSGGAVIGTYKDQDMYEALQRTYESVGCGIVKPIVV